MFDFITLRNSIVEGLYSHTGIPVVPTNSVDKRPKAPYHSYNFIVLYGQRDSPISLTTRSEESGDLTLTREELPSITLSLNTYSNSQSEAECVQECLRMREWFYHAGYHVLKGMAVVITAITAMQDRTILQNETEYQYRAGFDVQMRVVSTTEEKVGIIERVDYKQVIE